MTNITYVRSIFLNKKQNPFFCEQAQIILQLYADKKNRNNRN